MVEYNFSLDSVFGSLADPTRRDIIDRISKAELSVSEIALPYELSLAAVSKHLKILEKAKLIVKRRQGKQIFISLTPEALKEATDYLELYKDMLIERFDSLDNYLTQAKGE